MESLPEDEKRANGHSQDQLASQTASEYIDQQLALEADAKEILPYKFDKCTYLLGPLRQSVFACLTCNPPPASPAQVYVPAGICYACSISCHGEHNLVELFNRRSFVCDCGTTRMPSTPCTLRSDAATGKKGVFSQEAAKGNIYNQNFRNKFCGCETEYDAETEKGTMYQCLGLGSVENGGCGEDWWHPQCLMGLPPDWPEMNAMKPHIQSKSEGNEEAADGDGDGDDDDQEHPAPPGFPSDDDFTALICYKCVASNPWIEPYAGSPGFLPPLFKQDTPTTTTTTTQQIESNTSSLKRKAAPDDEEGLDRPSSPTKRMKEEREEEQQRPPSALLGESNTATLEAEDTTTATAATTTPSRPADTASAIGVPSTTISASAEPTHKHTLLPPAPVGTFSLLARDDFRAHLCHCPACFPHLIPYPQLQEEEEEYQPSLSASEQSLPGGSRGGAGSHGTGSILERGEAALSTMDRVRAIEGVMVYNQLRDKVKEFLKPYAESGQPVGAEDIKAYFEKLRGDADAVKEAREKPEAAAATDGQGDGKGGGGDDQRREQSGY